MYEWHTARLGDVSKGVAATIASLLTTILFTLLKKEVKVEVAAWAVWLFAIAVACAAMYAAYLSWRLARIPAEYAESLEIFQGEAAEADPPFPSAHGTSRRSF